MRKWFCKWWNTIHFSPRVIKTAGGSYCPVLTIGYRRHDLSALSSISRASAERNLAGYLGERIIKIKDFD